MIATARGDAKYRLDVIRQRKKKGGKTSFLGEK
jgi:hypothetical protein